MNSAEEYQHVGAYLRDVREHFKLDVETVSRALNIRAKYLIALEEGRVDQLPGKVYTRGYLNNYAEFLGLNAEDIVTRYRELEQMKEDDRIYVPEPTLQQNKPTRGMIVTSLVMLGLLYAFWSLWAHQSPHEAAQQSQNSLLPSAAITRISAATSPDNPCISPERLYPPCYMREEHFYHRVIRRSPVRSVVERVE